MVSYSATLIWETKILHTAVDARSTYNLGLKLILSRLQPHESLDTDVILLGHSMGGLLSAEVALLKEHRIVGTINFDTPFLGMHPGVIASGLGSVFRPAPDTPGQKPTDACQGNQEARPVPAEDGGETQPSAAPSYYPSEESSLTPIETSSTTVLPISSSASIDMPVKDSTYDPPFVNDVRIPQRTGWANALHFINKHSDGLRAATTSYVRSHLEFGGAMADYTGLKNRYGRLRMLEDVDSKVKARIRFVNYYTASTGRPKKHKSAPTSATMSRVNTGQLDGEMSEIEESGNGSNLELSDKGFSSSCLKIPIDRPEGVSESSKNNASRMTEHSVGETQAYSDEEGQISDASEAMDHIQPNSMPDSEQTEAPDSQEEPSTFQRTRSTADLDSIPFEPSSFASNAAEPRRIMPSLPPVPPTPSEPPAFDAASYTDKDTRKLAEKEHSRQVKAYRQALKDREKSISDRHKFLEKRERAAAKEREKLTAKGEKERLKVEQKGMEKGEKERSKQEREELKRLEKERVRMEKEAEKLKGKKEDPKPPVTATPPGDCAADEDGDSKPEKPKRDRKFCMLPSIINGQLDPCWIRVFMPGVDEVGAHCGLFTVDGERYQRFVEDVAERIEAWVIEGRV